MKCDTSPDKKEIVEMKLVTVSVQLHLLLHIFNNSRSLATVLPYKIYMNRMLQKTIFKDLCQMLLYQKKDWYDLV